MSSSIPAKTRFLLDENVRAELDPFLKKRGFDMKRLPKSSSDNVIAALSIKEKRVVVTNDEDFAFFPPEQLFGAVLLRIPQRDVQALHQAFDRLLLECKVWETQLITLQSTHWRASALPPHYQRTRRTPSRSASSKKQE